MTKKKDVKAKDCLELMWQFKAVDVTMKCLGGQSCTVSTAYTQDPTKKSQKVGGRSKPRGKQVKPSQPSSDLKKQCS